MGADLRLLRQASASRVNFSNTAAVPWARVRPAKPEEESMPQVPPEGMSQIIPYLYYTDVPKAVEWLARAFGLEKIMIEPSGNGRHHGEMRFGAGMIMMGTAAHAQFGSQSPREANAHTSGVFVYLADVDGHCARAKAAGAEIVQDLSDQEYGRTYWARDLDGHDWFFTRPPG
jgi:PhnB protein